MKRVDFLNPMKDGTCRTLKEQYYKSSVANFACTTARGASGARLIYETQ